MTVWSSIGSREGCVLPSTALIARLRRCFLEATLLSPTGNRNKLIERVVNFFEIEDFEYTIETKVFVDLTIYQVLKF